MKILLIGGIKSGPPGRLTKTFFNEFKKMNYELCFFDVEYEIDKLFISRFLLIKKVMLRCFSSFVEIISNKQLLNKYKGLNFFPDLILVFKQRWLWTRTLQAMKKIGNPLIFNFNADSPFDTSFSNWSKNIIRTIPIYDCYFIWSKALIGKLCEKKAQRVEYLPFAWDTELHGRDNDSFKHDNKYVYDVTFIGNWCKKRELWLGKIANYDLKIWGSFYWKNKCKNKILLTCWQNGRVHGFEMAKIIRSSKININILRPQNEGSINMRTFEIPGSSGFMLHERSDEVLDFFEEDKDIACFSTPDELREKIDYYLPKDDLRKQMAQRAHEKVKKHTYSERAKEILKVYGQLRRQ